MSYVLVLLKMSLLESRFSEHMSSHLHIEIVGEGKCLLNHSFLDTNQGQLHGVFDVHCRSSFENLSLKYFFIILCNHVLADENVTLFICL